MKTIVDKTKCVSVFHEGIYYLSFSDIEGGKVLLYYPDNTAFMLFKDIIVNDFLYRKNGTLEYASTNYSMKFDENKHSDFDVTTGLEKRIVFYVRTPRLSLGNFMAEKFIDKVFIQANVDTNDYDKYMKVSISVDYKNVEIDFQEDNTGLVWGSEWGRVWGNAAENLKAAFVRYKGNTMTLVFTNKMLEDIDTNIVIYGFAVSYKTLTPHQKFFNNQFN